MTFNLTHGDRCGKISEKQRCRPYFSEKMTRKKRGRCCKFLPCCSDTESDIIEDFANFEDTTLARGRVLLKRFEESHRPSVKDTETEVEEINITQKSSLSIPADGILDITPELDSSSSDEATDYTRGNDGYSKAKKHHSVPAAVDVVARHVKSPHGTHPLQVDSGRVDMDVKIKKHHSVPEGEAQRASREAFRTPYGIQPLQIKKKHDESDTKLKDRQSVPADEVLQTMRDVIKRSHSAQKKHTSYGHDVSAIQDDLKATVKDVTTPRGSEQEDVSSGKIDAEAEVRRSLSIQDVNTKQASKDSSKTSLSSQESDKVSEDKNIQDVDRNLPSPHVDESSEFSSGSDEDNVQMNKVTRDDTDAKISEMFSKPEDKAKATSDSIKQPHELKQSKVMSGTDSDDTKTRKQPNINEDDIKNVSKYDITSSDDFQRVQVHSESVDRKVKKQSGPSINGDGTSLPASEDLQMVKHDTHPPDKPVTPSVEDKKDNFDTDTEMEKHECVATEDRAEVGTSVAQSHNISQHFEAVTGKLTMKVEDSAFHQVDSTEAQATAAKTALSRPSSLPVVSVRDMQAAEHDHSVGKAAGGSPKVKKDKLRFVKSVHIENVDVSDTLHLMSREEEVHFLTLDTEDELEELECKAQKRKSKIPVRVKAQEKSDSGTDHSSGSITKLPAHQNRSSTRLPVPQTKSTTKRPALPSTATTMSSTSNTKQPSPPSKSTTKHSTRQGKTTTKQSSPPNGSATKDSAPQSKSVTKPSPPTRKQPSPPKTLTSKQPAPPPAPPSGPLRKPRVSRASKAKLPDDKFKFMKTDQELASPPDSDESILLKPANTRMKIPELFVDENAAAQTQESSGSDTDPDFYKLIGFDLDKARALKHEADSNPLRVISTKSDVLGVFIDSSDSSLRATDGSSTDPELYKLIDLNKKSDSSDEEFNNRPSCRLDKMESSLQKPISGPSPGIMKSQKHPVKMISASHNQKEVSVKKSKISSKISSGKSSSSTEDSKSSDNRKTKAKLGRSISKKDSGLGKVPSISKRKDISDSKLPIQLGAHPVVLNPIGSSSATPTDVSSLKAHKKGTLSQAGANYQVARRLDFSPPTGSSSDLSSPSEEPDKLQHRKVPRKRAPTAIFSESPSSSDSYEQQIEVLQGPTIPLSRPPSAAELQVPSTVCVSGAVSVIGYEREIDLREREAEISTSSLPAPLPTSDLLAPSPFMRRTGQPLPPVMGKSSSSCQEPQVTPELPTKKQLKMQDSLTLMGSKVKRPKPTKDVWFKQDETEPKDMRFTPNQSATKETQFKHYQTDAKEVRFQLDPTTSKELQIKQHSLSKKDITGRNESSSHKEVRFSLDPSSTRPRQDHACVNEPMMREDTPSDLHSRESKFRKEMVDPLKKDTTFKRDPSTPKEARIQNPPAKDSGLKLDPSTSKQTRFRQDSTTKDSGLGKDSSNAKEMWLTQDPQASGSSPRLNPSNASETRFRQYLPAKDSQLRLDPSSPNKARFREDPPDPAQELWFQHDSPGTDMELRLDPSSAQEKKSRHDPPATSSSFRQGPSTAHELRSKQDPPGTSSSFRHDPTTAQEMKSRHDPTGTSSSFRQAPTASKHVQFKGVPASKEVTTSNSQAPWLRRAQAEPQSAGTSSQLRGHTTEVRLTRRPRVEKPSLPPPKLSQSKKGSFPHVSKH